MSPERKGHEVMDSRSAREFNRIAKTAFAPVNPAVARQIVDLCGITEGRAVEIGSGPAHLAIELAKITDLEISCLDISADMRLIADENLRSAGLAERIMPLTGDVVSMPFADGVADLIISKGSVFFWRDLVSAFTEIMRVLRPGGQACVGGGFGSQALLDGMKTQMDGFDPDWITGVRRRLGNENVQRIRTELEMAGIMDFRIIHDPWQFWILIKRKPDYGR